MEKRIGIYPGSFQPFHKGHFDILNKSLKIFDKVIVAFGVNPEKEKVYSSDPLYTNDLLSKNPHLVEIRYFKGLLVDFIKDLEKEGIKISAVIRGLRNGSDLQYEMNMMYWNEDLGLEKPAVYFITDRQLSHISSSTIREIMKIREGSGK